MACVDPSHVSRNKADLRWRPDEPGERKVQCPCGEASNFTRVGWPCMDVVIRFYQLFFPICYSSYLTKNRVHHTFGRFLIYFEPITSLPLCIYSSCTLRILAGHHRHWGIRAGLCDLPLLQGEGTVNLWRSNNMLMYMWKQRWIRFEWLKVCWDLLSNSICLLAWRVASIQLWICHCERFATSAKKDTLVSHVLHTGNGVRTLILVIFRILQIGRQR